MRNSASAKKAGRIKAAKLDEGYVDLIVMGVWFED